MLRFCYVEICCILRLADFSVAHEITALAVTLMVMGNSKTLHVFNFVILLKSQKFDALKIIVFYNSI